MAIPVLITIAGTQRFGGEQPETIELITHGSYTYEPGCITFSYVETELTGLEGVRTTFTIEDGKRATLHRVGKVNSTMVFVLGQRDDSLYDSGFGTLLISVCPKQMTVLLNERGGIFDLEYSIDIEHTACGTNTYHIEIRPTAGHSDVAASPAALEPEPTAK